MTRLNEIIENSGFKLTFIAKKLDITYVALHNKLTGKRKFTIKEALTLKDLLSLNEDDFKDIFNGC